MSIDPKHVDEILRKIGREHLQQSMSRDRCPKGSSEWHRFNQGRWAFMEAAQIINRATGYQRNIFGEWMDEWSPQEETCD